MEKFLGSWCKEPSRQGRSGIVAKAKIKAGNLEIPFAEETNICELSSIESYYGTDTSRRNVGKQSLHSANLQIPLEVQFRDTFRRGNQYL